MEDNLAIIPPQHKKSCSKCRSRRVKCDMSMPTCVRCKTRGEICDICDMVDYDFYTVRKLQAEIERLRERNEDTSLAYRERNIDTDVGAKRVRHSTFNKSIEESVLLEVGTLSSTDNSYIGSASGAVFTKIFLDQLRMPVLGNEGISHFNNLDKLNSKVSVLQLKNIPVVSLPKKEVAMYLFQIYLEHVQIFYPIIEVNRIADSIEMLYQRSGSVHSCEMYAIFVVFSIASEFVKDTKQYTDMNDLNTSRDYFCMAIKYMDDSISTINLTSVRNILLLILWCLCLKKQDENENLWILTRHATSLCIQLGFHRNNPKWKLSRRDQEMRNRIWWTCFILERLVALQTGRTLSIRNYAIDAEMPKFTEDYDSIAPGFNLVCPLYEKLSFQPMYLLAKIRTIAGDILESIYVARGKGKTLAVESIYKSASRLREELDLWLESVMELYIRENDWVYGVLKLNYDICSLALSRPSPSFPDISPTSSKVCLNDSKSFIDVVLKQIKSNCVMDFWFISANILTVAVTFLFSSWVLDADFGITKTHIEKVQCIIEYLTGDSKCELPNVKIFDAVALYTLEHLRVHENEHLHPQNPLLIDRTFNIKDDDDRKQFILSYLLNISDDGPFYLVQTDT